MTRDDTNKAGHGKSAKIAAGREACREAPEACYACHSGGTRRAETSGGEGGDIWPNWGLICLLRKQAKETATGPFKR